MLEISCNCQRVAVRHIYVIMSPEHMCVGLLYAQASLALIIVTKGKIKKNSHGTRPTYKGPKS